MADMTRAIDFNSDLGESFGPWTLADDAAMARAIARGTARFSHAIPLVGLASSRAFAEAAADAGLPFVAEAFADRRYNPDGTLQSRAIAGSLITDPEAAAAQVLRIV